MSVKRLYRLSPVLWDAVPGGYAATVYGIDRMPEGPLKELVTCCPRTKEDPSYYWAGANFYRLRMPTGEGGCCSRPQNISDAVVYGLLPTFLSWCTEHGYQLPDNFQFRKLSPYDAITLYYESS